MKHLLLTTIAAVLVVGCGPPSNPEADRALINAAREGNIEAVKQHIAAGADVNAKSKDGTTPLHKAALKGHKEIAELLIAKGADIEAKSRLGSTPLHLATWGHTKIIELLIAKGADVNAKANTGFTPLDWAIMNRDTEIIDLLRKHGGKTGEELKAEAK
jgi:ankyrin repeat protein